MDRNIHKNEIRAFMLNRAERDIAFAHEVLWYYLSQLNEGNEEISYHTLAFLWEIIEWGTYGITKNRLKFLLHEDELAGTGAP